MHDINDNDDLISQATQSIYNVFDVANIPTALSQEIQPNFSNFDENVKTFKVDKEEDISEIVRPSVINRTLPSINIEYDSEHSNVNQPDHHSIIL